MRQCKLCQRVLPLEQFYKNPGSTGGRLARCKPCVVARYAKSVTRRRNELLAYVQGIKLERGCADCGYREHAAALDFDHLPGFEKKHRLATMSSGATKAKIDAEIAKCEVVCANCHRVRTAGRRSVRAAESLPPT